MHECYLKIDWDDDNYAELRRVVKIGNEIFENEECDDIPIVALSSIRAISDQKKCEVMVSCNPV